MKITVPAGMIKPGQVLTLRVTGQYALQLHGVMPTKKTPISMIDVFSVTTKRLDETAQLRPIPSRVWVKIGLP